MGEISEPLESARGIGFVAQLIFYSRSRVPGAALQTHPLFPGRMARGVLTAQRI